MQPLNNALWEASKYTVFCTEAEFYAGLAGCRLQGMYRDDKLVAVMTYSNDEFHLTTFGNYMFNRKDCFEILQPLLDTYGYAKTKTPVDDKRQQRFNERFGFIRTGEDDDYISYTYIPVGSRQPSMEHRVPDR